MVNLVLFHFVVVGLCIWGVDLHLHSSNHTTTPIMAISALGQMLNWLDSLSNTTQTCFLSSWRRQLPELLKCSHSPWFNLQSLFVFGIDHTRGLADGELCFPFGLTKIFQCLFQSPSSAPGFAECAVTTEHQSSREEASGKPLQDLSKDRKQQ